MSGRDRKDQSPNSEPAGEILFEIRRLGNVLRVAALDPVSNIEVVVSGPAAGGEAPLRQLARNKLSRALQQRIGGGRQ